MSDQTNAVQVDIGTRNQSLYFIIKYLKFLSLVIFMLNSISGNVCLSCSELKDLSVRLDKLFTVIFHRMLQERQEALRQMGVSLFPFFYNPGRKSGSWFSALCIMSKVAKLIPTAIGPLIQFIVTPLYKPRKKPSSLISRNTSK